MRGDEAQPGRVPLNRLFPLLRIIEAAGIALAPASIIVATLTALLLHFGLQLVDRTVKPDNANQIQLDMKDQRLWSLQAVPAVQPFMSSTTLTPWSGVVHPAVTVLNGLKVRTVPLNSLIRFALTFAIWSLVGVILCRRSALIFTGDDDATVRLSIQYGVHRWLSAAGAPLIPLSAAMLIGVGLCAFGFVGLVPWLCRAWYFVVSPVIAVMGFALAFLLLATAFGWPLMVAAVSTDGCDSFGGLSRAYSGITGRPWHLAVYVLVGLLVGNLLMWVVTFFGNFAVECAISGTVVGSGNNFANEELLDRLRMYVGFVLTGVAVSYFWSATTIIYLLLRQDVDGIPLDRIAADDSSQTVRDPLPVVGMPATDAESKDKLNLGAGASAMPGSTETQQQQQPEL